MVEAEGAGEGIVSRSKSTASTNMHRVIMVAAIACVLALGMFAMNSGARDPVELDRESREIERLIKEKAQLQAQLHPSSHPQVHHAASKSGKKVVATAAVKVEKKPRIDTLRREKEALEKQLNMFKVQAAKAKDPIIEGVLGEMNAKRDGTGLLGRLKESKSNVLGSLAATMSPADQNKMLLHEAEAMGDVSPKEALAQRIISLGSQYMHEDMVQRPAPLKRLVRRSHLRPQSDGAVEIHKQHSRHRIARLHAQLNQKPVEEGKSLDNTVASARSRVHLLRKELQEAERVEKLEAQLAEAKQSLSKTQSVEKKMNSQKLVARSTGSRAASRFDDTKETMKEFVGKASSKEDNNDEPVESTDENRFRRLAHGAGYVHGGIVVGTAENSGPDRYGQSGIGPALIRNKLGDNIIDTGMFGAAGTRDGDVLVPTKLSGARRRDSFQQSHPTPEKVGRIPNDVNDELVRGSTLHYFGGRGGLGISDSEVPADNIEGGMYTDSARTEELTNLS
ncbi:hypothetical protein GUITHDRAFT_160753 [Guillardia theta CCMP2712]|uniref:Uncharacterized protein n=1 Tax=Guillardia theta (strain CCMP2712) TaxID=905079 RepID=L1K074_GUITC|nr:hypothetical protein GUITHDRAFT_160753 [Guillardia theta CCMP2712]EKX53954.1 hypothetical protein GUITHDRAFT_160753 [Guillardia theta CCMP2712]|eukprot:XP_005840934.1 hypothetical protein GUITHDRAFT_160753 [Guillardia theta CCMP2712]